MDINTETDGGLYIGDYDNKQMIIAPYNDTLLNYDDSIAYCLTLGDSWKIPSKDELNFMYINKYLTVPNDNYNYNDGCYYTSSNCNDDTEWVQNFYNGYITNISKDTPLYCRPIKLLG